MTNTLLIQIAFRSLFKHKVRSFLTMLGIIIGISAIIATLAIGKGAEEKTRQRFLAMGNNYIEIFPGNWFQEGKTSVQKRRRAPYFTFQDVEKLTRLCPQIYKISPRLETKEVINFRENSILVAIKGGDENFLSILDRKIKQGSFFNKNHVKRGARVAILGPRAAKELFKSIDPIGQIIQIRHIPFTIIGITKPLENYRGIRDPNFDVLVPVTTIQKRIFKTGSNAINSMLISARSREEIKPLVRTLRKILRFKRGVLEDEPDNFTILDQASHMKAAESGAATVNLLLLIIASISLLVGGIGIMNIMLVSVTERTKEIGIRMALGANSRTILKQFLFESIFLCFIGGTIGILLGIAIPHIVAHFTGWNPITTLKSILLAFATTSIIGVFFGFYPARKAARMNPVDALMDR